jgi:hypothetical protein
MASSSLERVDDVRYLPIVRERLSFISYNGWICTECSKACAHEYDAVTNADNTFDWLHNGNDNCSSTTAGYSLDSLDNKFVPVNNDTTPCQETNEKQVITKFLAASSYDDRWRSTDDYVSLSRHDGKTFRTQLKAIFRHVLFYLAPNDVDVLWQEFIDDDTRKATETKDE